MTWKRATLTGGLLMTTFIASAALGDPLPRRAHWDWTLRPAESGAPIVERLGAGSPAARAGLHEGDHLVALNGQALGDRASIARAERLTPGGTRVRLEVAREGRTRTVEFVAPPLPEEKIAGADVTYGSVVTGRGQRLRTIVSRPRGAGGRLPAILLISWLSCDSVESPLGLDDGWSHLLRGLAERSGRVVMRVERPGVGDSEGDCAESDLDADLAGFRAAIAALRGLDFVDPERVVLLGSSIGGALAPVLATEFAVEGLVVSGGFTKTWFEHMLEIERTRLGLSGASAESINAAMRGYAELYSLYLNEGLTPGEAVARRPHLAPLWTDAPAHQYGRPAAYFHQVARLNVEAAWEKLTAPSLILYGEYDWIMSRDDHERAAAIANRRSPGRATLVILPKTGHGLDVFASAEKAFRWEEGRFDPAALDRVLEWLARLPG